MSNFIKISDSEWAVMRVVWEASKEKLTANEIVAALKGSCDWSPKTVRTLINRLVNKKALGFEASGRNHLYFASVEQEHCQQEASESFLERVFGGAALPMIAHFVESGKLSDHEIRRLRSILKNTGKKP